MLSNSEQRIAISVVVFFVWDFPYYMFYNAVGKKGGGIPEKTTGCLSLLFRKWRNASG